MAKFYLFLIIFIPLSALCKEREFYFSALTIEDGLSQNSVFSIIQDSDGYLWFGTENGLNRYDGYEFRTFYPDTPSLHVQSGGKVLQICEDRSKHLWILNENRVDVLNLQTEEMHSFPKRIKENVIRLHACPTGQMLAVTAKAIYLLANDSLKTLFSAPGFYFTAAADDSLGNLYVGTHQNGVLVFNTGKISNDTLLPGSYPYSGSLSRISLIHRDQQNRMWIQTAKEGLLRSDSAGAPFIPIPAESYARIDKSIRSIIDLDEKHLLLGTFRGLFLLDKQTGTTSFAGNQAGNPGALSHFSVYCLFLDHQNILWVGTNLGGVNYHTPYNNRFQFIKPERFSGVLSQGQSDSHGNLWFATEGGGLLSYDPSTGQQQNYLLNKEDEQNFSSNIIKSLCVTGDTIYCSTHTGQVHVFSARSGKFKLFKDFGYNNIYQILKDRKGQLWIPTYTNKGLVMIRDGKEINKFGAGKKQQILYNTTILYETRNGRILIGTRGKSFYCYDPQTEITTPIPTTRLGLPKGSSQHTLAFFEDSRGNIWIATRKNGIFVMTPDLSSVSQSFRNMPQESIFFITESPENCFWLVGSHELYRFRTTDESLQQFSSDNGMVTQEFGLTPGLLDQNGILYLVGNKGIIRIDTRNFSINTTPPKTILTTLSINNQKQNLHPDNGTPAHPLRFMRELTLNPDETNLTIGYTALNYIFPHNNRYCYYLEGIDGDWIQAGKRREAIYSNLPPGRYTFHVKAANNDGNWNPQDTQISIRVLAPLWQRWWAYLIYFGVLILIAQQYLSHLRKKQHLENELLEQRKNEEMNQERLRLFNHMAHEIRTPLMLMTEPFREIAEKTDHIAGIKELRKLVEQNMQRLLSLTNNLLEIQKRESGESRLTLTVFDFHEFIQDIYHTFRNIADERQVVFEQHQPGTPLPVMYDKGELEKVIFNLLSNAFKFTPVGGIVKLSAEVLSHEDPAKAKLKIQVEDNGIGITPEEKEHLFKPFSLSKKDLHGKIKGSGIGLSVVKHIVAQHGGSLEIEDSVPQGTCVTIYLPYHPATMSVQDVLPDTEEENGSYPSRTDRELLPFFHKTILLVEDESEILNYLHQKLSRSFRILTASNGNEALELLREKMPDLIVSDVMMPGMNGLELCQTIKQSPQWSHLPVILLTAKSHPQNLQEGYQCGADDYLVKPFRISALEARIRNILTERERLKEIYGKKLSLTSAGIQTESSDQVFMEKYISIVRANISDSNFNIDRLCEEIGMSRAAFYRKIKAISNQSPAEMIRGVRLECAMELLKTTKLTATEIALQVGFDNYPYFCQLFKTVYGIPPSKFREQ